MNLSKVYPVEQRPELDRAQRHDAIRYRRPPERSVFKLLVDKHEATAVPDQNLHRVSVLRAEDERRPGEDVDLRHLLHDRRQPRMAFAEVDRFRIEINPPRGFTQKHRVNAGPATRPAQYSTAGGPFSAPRAPSRHQSLSRWASCYRGQTAGRARHCDDRPFAAGRRRPLQRHARNLPAARDRNVLFRRSDLVQDAFYARSLSQAANQMQNINEGRMTSVAHREQVAPAQRLLTLKTRPDSNAHAGPLNEPRSLDLYNYV